MTPSVDYASYYDNNGLNCNVKPVLRMTLSASQVIPLIWWGEDHALMRCLQSNLKPTYLFEGFSVDSTSFNPALRGGIAHLAGESSFNLPEALRTKPWIFLHAQGSSSWDEIDPVASFTLPVALTHVKKALDAMIASPELPLPHQAWTLDPLRRVIKSRGQEVHVTEMEAKLLHVLFQNEQPPSFETLRDQVWDYAPCTSLETMEAALTHLQRKVAALGLKIPRPRSES